MTTNVKIDAHCSSDKEVFVVVDDDQSIDGGAMIEQFTLQDGESAERHIYDDRYLIIRERSKEA